MHKKTNKSIEAALDLLEQSDQPLSKIFKQDGLLQQLTKGLVERALQAKMKDI